MKITSLLWGKALKSKNPYLEMLQAFEHCLNGITLGDLWRIELDAPGWECLRDYFSSVFCQSPQPCETLIFGGRGKAQNLPKWYQSHKPPLLFCAFCLFCWGKIKKHTQVSTLAKVSIQSISSPHHILILTRGLLCDIPLQWWHGWLSKFSWSMWPGLLLEFKSLFWVHLSFPPRSFRPSVIYFK